MILLDTHTWFWWFSCVEKLSPKARVEIVRAEKEGEIGVSIMSCWEIAMLVSKERIGISLDVQEWIDTALLHPACRLLEITPRIAVLSTRLTGRFPSDPVDRLLIATAMTHGCTFVTKDAAIRKYSHVRSVW